MDVGVHITCVRHTEIYFAGTTQGFFPWWGCVVHPPAFLKVLGKQTSSDKTPAELDALLPELSDCPLHLNDGD